MQETSDLLELYRQAIAIGLAKPSEAGRLDFLALAERAKSHGKRAGALFFWLLREKKTLFITQGEEDAAVTRIRALHNPDNARSSGQQRWGNDKRELARGSNPLISQNPQQDRGLEPLASNQVAETHKATSSGGLSEDEQFVMICIRIAKQKRIEDPYRIARTKDWSREQWDTALASYEAKQWEQLQQSRSFQ